MVVAYLAGGPVDTVARVVASRLSELGEILNSKFCWRAYRAHCATVTCLTNVSRRRIPCASASKSTEGGSASAFRSLFSNGGGYLSRTPRIGSSCTTASLGSSSTTFEQLGPSMLSLPNSAANLRGSVQAAIDGAMKTLQDKM